MCTFVAAAAAADVVDVAVADDLKQAASNLARFAKPVAVAQHGSVAPIELEVVLRNFPL